MPQKKKQHYVPKFYMRQFADDNEKFSVLNLSDNKCLSSVPYKNQCKQDYYYGSDAVWENRLSEFETQWAQSINKVLSCEDLKADDIQFIKQFALYQRQRTLAEDEYRKQERVELAIETGKMVFAHNGWPFDEVAEIALRERAVSEITPAENLEMAMEVADIIDDLSIVVITYNTKRELVSSDVPVIAINPFHKFSIGYGCIGLVLLFPISMHQLIVLYDSKMYPRFKGSTYVELCNENEVQNLNSLQFISAEKILFAHNSASLLEFDSNTKNSRKMCRGAPALSTLGPDSQKIMGISMRKTLYDCELSFSKTTPMFECIPFNCRDAVPRKWELAWEEKLINVEKILPQLSEINPTMKKIGLTKKEWRKGCGQMTKAAQLYWQTPS